MPQPHGGGGSAPSRGAPLSASSLEAFSAAELALSGAGGLLLVAGALFVAGVASASRPAPVLRPFTALWAPRLGLHAAAAAALGAMLLRLPGWWSAGAASWAAEATPLAAQRLACRLSVAVAYGAALPMLGALAAGISAAPLAAPLLPLGGEGGEGRARRQPGARVLLLSAAAAAPAAAAQVLIAFHDDIFGPRGGLRRTFGPRWIDAFVVAGPLGPGEDAVCGAEDAACALCAQPLLASAVSALAALAFGGAQVLASRRLARAALSVRLASRARAVGWLLLLSPLLSAAARGVSCLFRPRSLWFELLMLADFVAVLLMAAAAALPLAVLPSVAAAQAGAAVGWGDPAAAAARDAAARGGALLQPLLLPAAEAAEAAEASVPATPAPTGGADAVLQAQGGATRSSAVLTAVGANSTRRELLAATPAESASPSPSQRSGSWSLRGGAYTGGSASGGSRYGTPYS